MAVTCPVPDCGKEFKANSGLSSHMIMAHKMLRSGEPLPPDFMEKRKAKLYSSKNIKRVRSNWHTKESREKARQTRLARYQEKQRLNAKIDDAVANASTERVDKHYAKLHAQGIFRCPECSRNNHKINDLPTATELGKHRRFAHGVLGRHHRKTQEALERRHEAKAAEITTNSDAPLEQNQCPQCERIFKSKHSLTIHIGRAHQVNPSQPLLPLPSPIQNQELIHGNGSTHRTAVHTNGHAEERRAYPNDSAITEVAIAIANAVGYIENYVVTTALKYDIPAKQFARRLIITLGEHYST